MRDQPRDAPSLVFGRLRFVSILPVAFAVAAASAPAQSITIANATVIDLSNGTLHPGTSVVIEGSRIASVGPSASTPLVGRVVDATGEYLIPGLWDMHTHAFFGWPAAMGNDYILPLFVANGVTGIRDMGSDLDAVLHARAEVAAHRLLGPRLIVAGPMLDGPETHYPGSLGVASAAGARRAVDSLARRGVDFIKVQSGVPRDAYFAVASETRKLGIDFVGHVPDAIRASEAVAAGQRSFEHLIGIFEGSSPDEDMYLRAKYLPGKAGGPAKRPGMFLETWDPARERRLIALLARDSVWQCPTLFWERGQWLVDTVDYTGDPDLPYAAASWVKTDFPAARTSILQTLDSDPLAVRARFVHHELDLVHRLEAAHVPFLAGTDTPAGVDVLPGISLHHELERFVAAGFTPLEALRTATVNPAIFLRRSENFGAVRAGYAADLVLLRANPLANIENTRSIAGVVADGRYLSDSDLDQLRARLKRVAATR